MCSLRSRDIEGFKGSLTLFTYFVQWAFTLTEPIAQSTKHRYDVCLSTP